MFKLIPRDRPSLSLNEFFSFIDMFNKDKVRELEEKFAQRIGADNAVAFPSGRIGLKCVYEALGIRGGKILASAFGCMPVADSIVWSQNDPQFADIEEDTYNIDPTTIKSTITSKTRAITAVHLFGLPYDVDEVNRIGEKYKLPIVEDAAMSYGAEYKGRSVGAFGIASVFSFEKSKPLTCWNGGLVCTNSTRLYESLLQKAQEFKPNFSDALISFVKMAKYDAACNPYVWNILYKIWSKGNLEGTANIGKSEQPVSRNFSRPFTPFQASMAIKQLSKLDKFVEKRRKIADFYNKKLESTEGLILPKEPPKLKHSFAKYTIRVIPEEFGLDRDELHRRLIEMGVDTGFWYIYSLPLSNYYRRKYGFLESHFPVASKVSKECLGLPIYPKLKKADAIKIVESIKSVKESL